MGRHKAQCTGAMLRSTGVGFFLACCPGRPPATTFVADDLERVSKHPARFRQRAPSRGVAAPEGANELLRAAASVASSPSACRWVPPSPSSSAVSRCTASSRDPTSFETKPAVRLGSHSQHVHGNVILLVIDSAPRRHVGKDRLIPFPYNTGALSSFSSPS